MSLAGIGQCVNKSKNDHPQDLLRSFVSLTIKRHGRSARRQTTHKPPLKVQWELAVSWADTLFVWFPASWMPLLMEAIRNKSSIWLRGNNLQGTVP